ncbi:MAG: hypothetical protein AB7D29_07720 [Campylobacterales bacterium]
MAAAPFVYDAKYSAIAIAYKNQQFIADNVFPRVPVGSKAFKYLQFPSEEVFTVVDTKIPRKGTPNVVEFHGQELDSSCEDYGLDDDIPNDDINNAPEGYDPVASATEWLANLVLLDRELRVANLLFNPANYASSKTLTLSGNSQFSDFVNSDPLEIISDAMDSCIMRPNTMTIGRAAFSKLRRHPKVVKAVNGNSGDSGVASRQAMAELFEVDNIFVGESFLNSAKKGQNAVMQRVWGKHISLTYIDKQATNQRGVTFGLTAQYQNRVSGRQDIDLGLNGGTKVRVGEQVKELIVAKDAGFFLQNVVA